MTSAEVEERFAVVSFEYECEFVLRPLMTARKFVENIFGRESWVLFVAPRTSACTTKRHDFVNGLSIKACQVRNLARQVT